MKEVKLIALMSLFLALALFQGSAQATLNCHCASMDQNVSIIGTLIEYHQTSFPGDLSYWTVKVDEVLAGPHNLPPTVKVITYQAVSPPKGAVEPGLNACDRVWVFGAKDPNNGGITLIGSKYYFIEKGPKEIELMGTALDFHQQGGFGNGSYWTIKVDRVICGPWPCSRVINVTTWAPIFTLPWGCSDSRIKPCNRVIVFGTYHTLDSLSPGNCGIWLFGSREFFMEKFVRQEHREK